MTQDEMKTYIRNLTQRIGEAKRNGVTELVERLRYLRVLVMQQLAEAHDVWTLINSEGQTEFVGREAWDQRVAAWLERKRRDEAEAGGGEAA